MYGIIDKNHWIIGLLRKKRGARIIGAIGFCGKKERQGIIASPAEKIVAAFFPACEKLFSFARRIGFSDFICIFAAVKLGNMLMTGSFVTTT